MNRAQAAQRIKPGGIAWTISRRLAMVVVLALAFVLSAVVTIYTLFRIGDTRVPDLIGKPEAEAQKIAEKAGLKVRVQKRNDAAIPANMVIKTPPEPQSLANKYAGLTFR